MAKSKNRPSRKGKKSSRPTNVSADVEVESSDSEPDSELNEATESMAPIEPVIRRPLLFKISLVAFVGWLIYLAYVAYVVLG